MADRSSSGAAVMRHLRNARRETLRAVERFADITDPLRGHRVEAVRQAGYLRDEAEKAVAEFESEGGDDGSPTAP